MMDPGPAVIVVTGVMAAGKSTVAQLLAEHASRGVHVRGDVFRRMIVSGREELMPDEQQEALAQISLRYRLSASVADGYATAGFTTVVQDVILGKDLTDYAELIATRPLYVVVLAPRPDVVVRRENDRAKKGYGAWTVEALDESLRLDTPRLGLWIDNSAQTPAETVVEILNGMEVASIDW